MKKLHLICNAHIDPIWLWEWEEGASAAISTFRSAADLADNYDYVFCHNEVTLYEWVKEYEPELFNRIKELVAKGKWHIMGGWYLQPDCNLPCGEALIRQIMTGREYFRKHFGAVPSTAVNVDPFGHSFGLVQILRKCSYDSYLFCRPYPDELKMDDSFIWKGPDGSEIVCFRAATSYNSPLGEAVKKIDKYIRDNRTHETGMLLWGVGNHGGGPSRKDLEDIGNLRENAEIEILHSKPEDYFKEAQKPVKVFERSLYPSMVGCYSSQNRVKQKYRKLEDRFFFVEKMCTAAHLAGLYEYPHSELDEAMKDMLNAQFHDILPGSSIKAGEEAGLRLMEHALEILSRVRARAFFSLISGEPKTIPGEYSILVYNPYPYDVETVVECELQLENQNWNDEYSTSFQVFSNGKKLSSQLIKEDSNLNLDWRKRLLFKCILSSHSMSRFECRPFKVFDKPAMPVPDGDFVFDNGILKISLCKCDGLLGSICYRGKEFVSRHAFQPVVISDTVDPWALSKQQRVRLGDITGVFSLADACNNADLLSLPEQVEPVRIIEDGGVATIVEAVFSYHHSYIVVDYIFYKTGDYFDIKYTVFWNEKSKALKITVPTAIDGEYYGETVFATEKLPVDGHEVPMQRWCCVSDGNAFFGIINDGTYSSSCDGSDVQLTLLRSPCYAAHPIADRQIIPHDRYVPRIDQGEHTFGFRICVGHHDELKNSISLRAQLFNAAPYALNVFPSGNGVKKDLRFTIDNEAVLLTAHKITASGETVIRIFNSSGEPGETNIYYLDTCTNIKLGKYEFRTYYAGCNGLKEVETPLI